MERKAFMRKLIFISILSLTFFQACGTKQPIVGSPTEKSDQNITTLSSTDEMSINEFSDEFSDEFSTETKELFDPLYDYNVWMTDANDQLFIHLLNPLSEAYAYILPHAIRLGLSNAIHNLKYPIRLSNNLLQGKIKNASDETGRFIINSTVGLLGVIDVAGKYKNLHAHNEDFGQTLGYYGVGSGFHIVLPFVGPSNARDVLGLIIDGYTSPLIYDKNLKQFRIPKNLQDSTLLYALENINKNALNLGAYESLKKDAIELYPFLRDIYEQKRSSDISE
ncbi:MAG: putative periplasmic protein (vacJ homolog) [uncultured Sulfurovum sp.]|uniref:Putative periplasmic protein (VacJ homolog) n=1 Tax=uncultured Sulfurovum sp. TaxID=269237 RepID=A0A6S6U8Z0_9BACT|nr:MAG: putative periplasmic protein (vacJ homolog) [uncultured Sulfurovum sp.]